MSTIANSVMLIGEVASMPLTKSSPEGIHLRQSFKLRVYDNHGDSMLVDIVTFDERFKDRLSNLKKTQRIAVDGSLRLVRAIDHPFAYVELDDYFILNH